MSITGKASLSLKKTDLIGQKIGASGQRKVVFAHKAVAGETGINLSSLTTPTEFSSVGFTQPSPALLAAANLKFFRNNLTLISSVRGILQDYASYTVNNSTQINFTDSFGTALDNEIFTGIIDAVPRNDLVGVDSTSILASGTLTAGTVQFNVGSAFKVNANPSTQIGEIAVYLDGRIQFRNVGNATAAPGADGNYQEIDNGSSYGTIIEFNEVDIINNRAVIIIGTGISVIRPNGSLVQELESLAGQLDAMIPTLAAVAGVPESTFQSAPNNVDLKTFGDRVLSLENTEVSQSAPGHVKRAGQLKGTNTNDAASAGYVGEYVISKKSTNTNGSTVLGTYTDVGVSMALTPGDWDIEGFATTYIEGAVGAGVVAALSKLVITDAANNVIVGGLGCAAQTSSPLAVGQIYISTRISITTTTTYKMRLTAVANSGVPTFSTLIVFGNPDYPITLQARRIR